MRRVLVLLAAIALVLSACGTSETPSPGASGSGGPQPSGGGGGTPREGGTLVVATHADPDGIDPGFRSGDANQVVLHEIFEGLVGRDRVANPERPPVVPRLAESWVISDDGLTYTFTLRRGVKFHDGTDFNAEAVQFNFERWRNPDFDYYSEVSAGQTATIMNEIASTRVVDESTFEFVLKAPDAGLLGSMSARGYYAFVSPAAIQEYGNDGFLTKGIGTGPLKLKEYVPNDRTVLVRNDEYWGEKPHLDQVIFRPILDTSARIAALLAGEVDVIDQVPADAFDQIRAQEGLEVLTAGRPNIFGLLPNFKEEPGSILKVREAMSLAIDREAIANELMGGAHQPASQLYGLGNDGFDPALEPLPYDPDRARELLAEAGYPDGFQARVLCTPDGGGIGQGDIMMEAVQAQFAAVGIDIEVELTEWNAYVTEWLKGVETGENIAATCMSMGSDDITLMDLYGLSSNQPPACCVVHFYSNPEVDDLLHTAAASVDPDEYLALHRQAQEIMIRQDYAYIPIVLDGNPMAINSAKVKGWVPAAAGVQYYAYAWVTE